MRLLLSQLPFFVPPRDRVHFEAPPPFVMPLGTGSLAATPATHSQPRQLLGYFARALVGQRLRSSQLPTPKVTQGKLHGHGCACSELHALHRRPLGPPEERRRPDEPVKAPLEACERCLSRDICASTGGKQCARLRESLSPHVEGPRGSWVSRGVAEPRATRRSGSGAGPAPRCPSTRPHPKRSVASRRLRFLAASYAQITREICNLTLSPREGMPEVRSRGDGPLRRGTVLFASWRAGAGAGRAPQPMIEMRSHRPSMPAS